MERRLTFALRGGRSQVGTRADVRVLAVRPLRLSRDTFDHAGPLPGAIQLAACPYHHHSTPIIPSAFLSTAKESSHGHTHPNSRQAGTRARAQGDRQATNQPGPPHTQTQAHRQRATLDETRLRVLFYPRRIRPGCPPRTAYPPAAPPAACTAPPRFPPAPPPPSSSSSSPTQTLRKTGRALPANERGGKQAGAEQSKFSSRGIHGESRALIAILHQYTQAPSILTTIVF